MDSTRLGGGYNTRITVGGVGGGHAAIPVLGGACPVLEQVNDVVPLDLFGILKSGFDDQVSPLYEDVFIPTSGLLKFAIAASALACLVIIFPPKMTLNLPKASNLNLFGPDIAVEAITIKIFVKKRAIRVVDNVANAIPHQEARNR